MSKLEQRFEEDRRLRDTARAVLMDDIAHARVSFSPKGVADRTVGRVGDGARDVYEVSKIHFNDNRGIVAIVIGLLLVWLGREPIMEALGMVEEAVEDALENALDETESSAPAGAEADSPAEPEIPAGDDNEH